MRYYHYGKKYNLNNVVLEEPITLSRKFTFGIILNYILRFIE